MALVPVNNQTVEENGEEENGSSGIFQRLYDLEKRVETLRDQAVSIEQEKLSVLRSLQELQDNEWLLTLSAEEKEEIEANAERLVCRCLTVEISVTTPRNEIQEKALHRIDEIIQELESQLSVDQIKGISKANSYLGACSADCSGHFIDHRFQGILLDCTADDQKAIRKKLQKLLDEHKNIDESIS